MSNTSRLVKPLGDISPYAFDRTGTLPANKVIERRTLTNENRSDFNHIIPYSAPFYSDTVVVKHVGTDETLVNGRDYYLVGTFLAGIVNNINYKPVAYAIVFDNPTVTGEFEITYQTMGGDASLDTRHYVELITNHMENPRTTDWEQIIGRPVVFPPEPHPLHIGDTIGWDTVEGRIKEVADAILQLKRDESQANPSYAQLITEMFRFNDRLDKTDRDFEAFRQVQLRAMSGQVIDLTDQITALDAAYKAADVKLNSDLTGLINQTRTTLDTKINTKERELTSSINNVNTTLTNKISTDIAAAVTPINRNITTLQNTVRDNRTELSNLIDSKIVEEARVRAEKDTENKTYTDTKFSQADTKLTQQVAAIDGKIASVRSDLTRDIGTVTSNLNTEKNRITGILDRLNAADASNEFVKRTGNQEITGTKTFVGNVILRNPTTNTKSTVLGRVNDGFVVNVQTGTASKIFSIKENGEVIYDNKRLLNTDDLRTINTEAQRIATEVSNTLVPRITTLEGKTSAVETRLNGNEFVKTTTNQNIDGLKKFIQPLTIQRVNDTSRFVEISRQQDHTAIVNKTSTNAGQTLQLKDNGEAWYNAKRLLNTDDLTNPVSRITALETWKGTHSNDFTVLKTRVDGLSGRLDGNEFVKVAGDTMTGPLKLKSADVARARLSNDDFAMSGFIRHHGGVLNGNTLPLMSMHMAHPNVTTAAHSRGIGFSYGSSENPFSVYTTAWNANAEYIGMKEILTENHWSDINRISSHMLYATTKSLNGWVGLKLQNHAKDRETVIEVEPSTQHLTIKNRNFLNITTENPVVTDWYVRFPSNNNSGNNYVLMSGGTAPVGAGTHLSQAASGAPLLVTYKNHSVSELYTTHATNGAVFPLVKSRFNRGDATRQSTLTAGFYSGPNTNEPYRSAFIIMNQRNTETVNVDKGEHTTTYYFWDSGRIESAGNWQIEKTTDLVRLRVNKATVETPDWHDLSIKNDGHITGPKGYVYQEKAFPIIKTANTVAADDTRNSYAGFTSEFTNKKFIFEWMTRSDGLAYINLKNINNDDPSSVDKYQILFPQVSGKIPIARNATSASTSMFTHSGFIRTNGGTLDGKALPSFGIHLAHHDSTNAQHSRGIGFTYGSSAEPFKLFTTAFNKDGVYQGMKEILTELHLDSLVAKKSELPTDYVKLTTNQEISGHKNFRNDVTTFANGVHLAWWGTKKLVIAKGNDIRDNENILFHFHGAPNNNHIRMHGGVGEGTVFSTLVKVTNSLIVGHSNNNRSELTFADKELDLVHYSAGRDIRFRMNCETANDKYIWTSARNIKLQTDNERSTTIGRGANNNWVEIFNGGSSGNGSFRVYDNGRFGFYSSNLRVHVNSNDVWFENGNEGNQEVLKTNFMSAANYYRHSDERLKTNIQPIVNALDKLKQVNGYTYTVKGSTLNTAGVVAQQLENHIPDLVSTNNEGFKSVDYDGLIGYLIEALKESESKREALEDRLTRLESLLLDN